MHNKDVCMDDIEDVTELSNKLMFLIGETLKGHDIDIAISSLINACINTMYFQSTSQEEFIYFKELFNGLYNVSLNSDDNKFIKKQ